MTRTKKQQQPHFFTSVQLIRLRQKLNRNWSDLIYNRHVLTNFRMGLKLSAGRDRVTKLAELRLLYTLRNDCLSTESQSLVILSYSDCALTAVQSSRNLPAVAGPLKSRAATESLSSNRDMWRFSSRYAVPM